MILQLSVFVCFCLFLAFFKFVFVVVGKNISMYARNYIIYFNDKSRELFTLNSCGRGNMEQIERILQLR